MRESRPPENRATAVGCQGWGQVSPDARSSLTSRGLMVQASPVRKLSREAISRGDWPRRGWWGDPPQIPGTRRPVGPAGGPVCPRSRLPGRTGENPGPGLVGPRAGARGRESYGGDKGLGSAALQGEPLRQTFGGRAASFPRGFQIEGKWSSWGTGHGAGGRRRSRHGQGWGPFSP
jgi:hypothetical protein